MKTFLVEVIECCHITREGSKSIASQNDLAFSDAELHGNGSMRSIMKLEHSNFEFFLSQPRPESDHYRHLRRENRRFDLESVT